MKKRLVAALLASTMVLGSLAGCGSSSKDDSAKTDETLTMYVHRQIH